MSKHTKIYIAIMINIHLGILTEGVRRYWGRRPLGPGILTWTATPMKRRNFDFLWSSVLSKNTCIF